MRVALGEARKGLGKTSPNPAVGALLVVAGRVIGRGHHRVAGGPHAEIECLSRVKGAIPPKAVLYLTLEPCSTAGRTQACTDAILKSGVKRVVVGAVDPNPQHQGRGIKLLRNAGIEVETGLLADECSRLNEAFNKWIVTGRPFVIAKCGMSLDGKLTRSPGEPRWITSNVARRHALKLRAQVDAILVGAKTLRADNPRLTVRGIRGAKQPWRVVVSRSGNLPKGARLFRDKMKSRTLVYQGASLSQALNDLGKKEVTSVLIEGGGEILGAALDARLIDRVQIYLGPLITGGPVMAFAGKGCAATSDAARLEHVTYNRMGSVVWVTGYPNFSDNSRIIHETLASY